MALPFLLVRMMASPIARMMARSLARGMVRSLVRGSPASGTTTRFLFAHIEGLEPALAQLAELQDGMRPAAVRALNRTAAAAATFTRRQLAQVTGLTQARIRPSVVVERATLEHLVAVVRVMSRRRPFPLIAFTRLVATRKGKYGRYPVARGRVHVDISPHAFVARMRSGHTGVYQRTGEFGRNKNPRLEKIDQLEGPQLPDVMRDAHLEAAVRAKIAATLGPTLQHEIAFLAGRVRGGRS